VIGRRSMLEHTLARVERLIARDRILIVVSPNHREEVGQQLGHWPAESIIFQPANRETAPGILLPLVHLWHRDASARWPSFPPTMIVERFWEKPALAQSLRLLERGALWNTFVCVARATTLWDMVRCTAPDLYAAFVTIHRTLGSRQAAQKTAHVCQTLRSIDFCSEVSEHCVPWLRVLPVPEVGWSDWGSAERILASLQRIGKLDGCFGPAPEACSNVCSARRRVVPVEVSRTFCRSAANLVMGTLSRNRKNKAPN